LLSRLEKFALNLVVFAKLLGTTTLGLGFLSLLLINRNSLKLSCRELLFIGAVLFQLFFSFILSGNSLSSFTNTLFYFSFLFVYVFLKDKNTEDLVRFLRYMIFVMFVFVLIEFAVLNSPLTNFIWYFPEGHTHRSEIMGFQRAQGLGAISSSSGAVAVLSLALYLVVSNQSLRFYKTIVILTVVLLMTGTGFFLLFAYLLLQAWMINRGAFSKFFLLAGLIALLLLALFIFEKISLNRFTFTYFMGIYEWKIYQYKESVFDNSIFSIIFGGQSNSNSPLVVTSSDFAIMGLFEAMGLYSMVLVIVAPLWLVGFQRKFLIVLMLYWLSWLHYPAMGSPVGGVFLGLFLALYRQSHRSGLIQNHFPTVNLRVAI
jgi:hypothetical protein